MDKKRLETSTSRDVTETGSRENSENTYAQEAYFGVRGEEPAGVRSFEEAQAAASKEEAGDKVRATLGELYIGSREFPTSDTGDPRLDMMGHEIGRVIELYGSGKVDSGSSNINNLAIRNLNAVLNKGS